MQKVILHGDLKEKFGGPFEFELDTVGQALTALAANLPDFTKAIDPEGEYKIICGGIELSLDELSFTGGGQDIHIIPQVKGSGGGGGSTGKIIIGVGILTVATMGAFGVFAAAGAAAPGFAGTAFTVLGSAVTWGNMALMGAAMILGGISMAMASAPTVDSYGNRESPDQKPSFLYNGAVNTIEQGGAVPLVYGKKVRVGSTVISAGLTTEQLPV